MSRQLISSLLTKLKFSGVRVVYSVENRYEILEELGRGGMGVVYKALDRNLGRLVALKTVQPEVIKRPELSRVLFRELKITSALSHPGIPEVYEVGISRSGQLFIVMKLVQGCSLRDLIQRSKVEQSELFRRRLLKILRSVSEVVSFAKSNGIVHCDLKPENILIGSNDHVWVIDWGLAINFKTPQVGLEVSLGTPGYTAPEILSKEGGYERSDSFSLGVMLLEIVSVKANLASLSEIERLAIGGDGGKYVSVSLVGLKGEWKALGSVVRDCVDRKGESRIAIEEFKDELDRFLKGERLICHPYHIVDYFRFCFSNYPSISIFAFGFSLTLLVWCVTAALVKVASNKKNLAYQITINQKQSDQYLRSVANAILMIKADGGGSRLLNEKTTGQSPVLLSSRFRSDQIESLIRLVTLDANKQKEIGTGSLKGSSFEEIVVRSLLHGDRNNTVSFGHYQELYETVKENEIDPRYSDYKNLVIAVYHYSRKEYIECRQYLRKIKDQKQPWFWKVLFVEAAISRWEKNYHESVRLLEIVCALNKAVAPICKVNQIALYSYMQKPSLGLVASREVMSVHSEALCKKSDWLCLWAVNTSNCLVGVGKEKDAKEILEFVLTIVPDSIWILKSKAALFSSRGEMKEALFCLNSALSIQPNDPSCLLDRALIYFKSGDIKAFLEDCDAILSQVELASAHLLLAQYWSVKKQDYIKAIRHLKKARLLNPHLNLTYELFLKYYARLEKYDKALAFAKLAKRNSPNKPMVNYNLGYIHYQLGQHKLAEKYWKFVIQNFPGTPIAEKSKGMYSYMQLIDNERRKLVKEAELAKTK